MFKLFGQPKYKLLDPSKEDNRDTIDISHFIVPVSLGVTDHNCLKNR